MSAASWPRSIRPDQRDPILWNTLLDGSCIIARAFRDGDRQVVAMTASVINGDGHLEVITWDGLEYRRLRVDDEAVPAGDVEAAC